MVKSPEELYFQGVDGFRLVEVANTAPETKAPFCGTYFAHLADEAFAWKRDAEQAGN
jgi:hypothetical protein